MAGKIRFFLSLLVICAASIFSVLAQEEVNRPQRHKETEFQKKIAVNYILLDVIVTDRGGNYVRNLTKDDFEVFESGRKVQIESIDEYQMLDLGLRNTTDAFAPELQPVEQQPPRNIIILFDLFFSSTFGIKRAVETAEDFITNRIQPGDKIMVLSYFQSLNTIQPFTSDKFKAIKSMREMGLATDLLDTRPQPASGWDLAKYSDSPFDASEDMAGGDPGRLIADMEETVAGRNIDNYLLSLETLADVLKYQPGRKTLVLLSEGINFDLIDPTNLNLDKFGPGGRTLRSADSPGISISRLNDYKDVVERLNDAQISVYTINVGGLKAPGEASKRLADMDSLTQQKNLLSETDHIKRRQDFLSNISAETGGRAYFNANNILALLNQIEVDISNYYILGFRTSFDPANVEFRKISVRTVQKGLKVLHRKGYFTPQPFNSLNKDELNLHLTEGFLSHSSINDLDAAVKYEFVRPAPDKLDAMVCIQVPLEQLVLERGKLAVELLVSNINDEGKIFSSVHKLYSLEQAGDPELQEKGLRIVETLTSDKGFNRIRIALRDNNSGKRSYFYNNYKFMPVESDDSLLLSQPFFFDPADKCRSVDEFGLSVKNLEEWNENPAGGYDYLTHPVEGAFYPRMNPDYKKGAEVDLLVVLKNLRTELSRDSVPQFEFAVSPTPVGDAQRAYFRVNPHQQLYRLRTGGGVVMLAKFSLGDLEPGEYDLMVISSEKATGRNAASAARFRVVE
jgi:VWFA-related protein